MAWNKCKTPGCGVEWVASFDFGDGLCPSCHLKTTLAPTATGALLEYDAEFVSPLRDAALAAIGRAFDDAIDLAYLGG